MKGEGKAVIMHEPRISNYFYHGKTSIDILKEEQIESTLSKVKENSFVSSLKRYR